MNKSKKPITPSPDQIRKLTLQNSGGMKAEILNYGGTLHSLSIPTKDGQEIDVVLGFNDLEDYLNNSASMGVLVGRYGNRIGNGTFTLDGQTYQLEQNLGAHHLHGGSTGFQRRYWTVEHYTANGPQLILSYTSAHMEDGYPGELKVNVTFTLTDEMGFKITYQATSDAPTILNLTHHAYFNLSAKGSILDHELWLDADEITETNETMIPTGKYLSVEGTPFDFRTPARIGSRIEDGHPQLKNGLGYDHNYVLNRWDGSLQHMGTVANPANGLSMKFLTTEPGVQFYTANHLDERKGKKGVYYQSRSGFCLEAQHFPDSPNQAHFPSTVLRPKEQYHQITEYRFD